MLVENIYRLCDARKISIYALERDLEFGNGTIGKWKGMKGSPKVDAVKKIADYFGVTVDDLLFDTGQGGEK